MVDLNKTVGELGTTQLKQAITYLAQKGKAAFGIDTNQDGNIDTGEILAYSISLLPTLPGMFPVFKGAVAEAIDIKGDEFTELVAHVQATDFLPDEYNKAEAYAKAVVLWLNVNRGFTEFNLAFFGGNPEAQFDLAEYVV